MFNITSIFLGVAGIICVAKSMAVSDNHHKLLSNIGYCTMLIICMVIIDKSVNSLYIRLVLDGIF